MKRKLSYSLIAALPFAILLQADNHGADPGLTAAPGEQAATCTQCHSGTALNAGGGSLKIVLPGEKAYTPGVTQRIKVQIEDSTQRRWGYELSARVSATPSAQAGDLATPDSNSQVICANGRAKPCASAETVQFITHTLAGSRPGATGSAEFEVDWTPPAASAGKITLYAAANAANGDNRNSGDHIYTASIELEPADAAPSRPAISSEKGVRNAATGSAAISPGAWLTIEGTNLASTSRTWTPADFMDGAPPVSLDGVGVTINGKDAFVQSISPTRLTVLSPADDAVGPVEVRVSVDGKQSDPSSIVLEKLSPAFFLAEDGKHVRFTADGTSLIEEPGLMPTRVPEVSAAKSGDVIVLYGTGFGITDPETPLPAFTLTIGGVPAETVSITLATGAVRIHEFHVRVPEGLTAGDHAVIAEVDGAKSPGSESCCLLTIQ